MAVRTLRLSLLAALLVLSLLGANTAAAAVSVTQTITTTGAAYQVIPTAGGSRAIALHGGAAGAADAVSALDLTTGTATLKQDSAIVDASYGAAGGGLVYLGNQTPTGSDYFIPVVNAETGISTSSIIIPGQTYSAYLGTSPDGTKVVSFNDGLVSANASVVTITAGTDDIVNRTIPTSTNLQIYAYAFAPDSSNVFFSGAGGGTAAVYRLNLSTNAVSTINVGLSGAEQPQGLAVSPDGRYLAVAIAEATVILHEFATGTNTRISSGIGGAVSAAPVFSRDGRSLYALTATVSVRAVYAIDVATATVRSTIDLGLTAGLGCADVAQYCLAATSDRRHLLIPMDVSGTADDRIALIDTRTETLSSVTVGNNPKYVWPSADGVTAFVSYGGTSPDVTVLRTASAPGAPTGVTATPANAAAAITWTAPTDDGGSDITNYTATANPGGRTCTWTSGTLGCTVDGLTNGTAYTFTVTATNAAGASAPSAASAAVTPGVAPGAPTKVKATPGPKNARISWTAPAAKGAGITGYVVTASPGGATCTTTTTTCTISRLLDTKAYTFRVRATSAVGDGAASAATKAVRPYTRMKAAKPRVQGARILLRITAPAAGRITVTGTTSTLTACTRTGRARGKGAVALTCTLRAAAVNALKRAAQRVTVLTLLTTKKGRTYGASQTVTIKRTRG